MLKIPRIVAAQRLQVWLLFMALVALLVTSLLVLDLARTRRASLLAETRNNLRHAVDELLQAARAEIGEAKADGEDLDRRLGPVSYQTLRDYLDVEGGYLWRGQLAGHSFPSYTEPGSVLRQPPFERQLLDRAIEESKRRGGTGFASAADGEDMVLVAASWDQKTELAAWALRRMIHFSDTREYWRRIWLVATMLIALLAATMVLRLSFKMQSGFSAIADGLKRLRTDPSFRFADQNRELKPIVDALNEMAESRQRLEADLRREDRLRIMGRVVAGVAHEIRNPLNSIRLTARVLARRLAGNPETAEPIQLITGEIDRLDRILRSLSAFRADEPAAVREQSLKPLLEQTLALVEPQARDHGVTLELTGDVAARAAFDADLLKQSLINVLLNAIDASPRGGAVRLQVEPAADAVTAIVEDSGPGLNPDQMDRIFEAFYTTKPGGAGLGLAVTRTLLEKMNASITAENASRGARFRIRIPAKGPQA